MKLLIQSIKELAPLVSFSGDLEFSSLESALWQAQNYLVRYVGFALLDELGGNNLLEKQEDLMPFVQAPIAQLALLKFSQAANVRITDMGLLRTKTADSNDAFEWQVERTVVALKNDAFESIETLLRYLEAYLGDFPSYASSDAYKSQKGKLIPTAQIFLQYYDIGESRLILQTLGASMRTAELGIRKLLGAEQLALLLGDTLTELQAEQLDAARRALAYLTIARALREKLVSISDTGVQVCGISNFGTLNYKQPASDKQLEMSIQYFDSQAAGFVADLITLLTPVLVIPSEGVYNPILNLPIVAL